MPSSTKFIAFRSPRKVHFEVGLTDDILAKKGKLATQAASTIHAMVMAGGKGTWL